MNQYYYLNKQGQQIGPMDLAALKFVGLKPDTLVWCSGMSSWMAAKDVPEVNSVIANSSANTPPAPPYQQQNNNQAGQNVNNPQTGMWGLISVGLGIIGSIFMFIIALATA